MHDDTECITHTSQLVAFLLQLFLNAGLLYYGHIVMGVLMYVGYAVPCCCMCCVGAFCNVEAEASWVVSGVLGCLAGLMLVASSVAWLTVLILISIGSIGPANGCPIDEW